MYAIFWLIYKERLGKWSVPGTLPLCYSLCVRDQVTNMKPTVHLTPYLLICVM